MLDTFLTLSRLGLILLTALVLFGSISIRRITHVQLQSLVGEGRRCEGRSIWTATSAMELTYLDVRSSTWTLFITLTCIYRNRLLHNTVCEDGSPTNLTTLVSMLVSGNTIERRLLWP